METAQLLKDAGSEIGQIDRFIFAIARSHNSSYVDSLLEQGFDVDEADSNGRTGLMWAVQLGKTELVKILLAKGARVNAKDEAGDTALMFVFRKKSLNWDIINELILYKADLNLKNSAGESLLDIVYGRGSYDLINQVRKLGARSSKFRMIDVFLLNPILGLVNFMLVIIILVFPVLYFLVGKDMRLRLFDRLDVKLAIIIIIQSALLLYINYRIVGFDNGILLEYLEDTFFLLLLKCFSYSSIGVQILGFAGFIFTALFFVNKPLKSFIRNHSPWSYYIPMFLGIFIFWITLSIRFLLFLNPCLLLYKNMSIY